MLVIIGKMLGRSLASHSEKFPAIQAHPQRFFIADWPVSMFLQVPVLPE